MGLVVDRSSEMPEPVGWGRGDRAAFHLAALFRDNEIVRKRLLSLDPRELTASGRDLLVRTLLQVDTEDAVFRCLAVQGEAGVAGYTVYKLHERLEALFIDHVPVQGSTNAYRLAPRAANEFRSRLLEVSQVEGPMQRGALDLLMEVELWRLEHGRPSGEVRNPLFPAVESWPQFCDGRPDSAGS